MRASSSLALTVALGFGVLLGACGDDDDGGNCTNAQTKRGDTILMLASDETAGASVFAQSCGISSCHGSDGSSGPAPNLGSNIAEFGDTGLACLVLAGTGSMPSQGSLTDQELADVLAYVLATF